MAAYTAQMTGLAEQLLIITDTTIDKARGTNINKHNNIINLPLNQCHTVEFLHSFSN